MKIRILNNSIRLRLGQLEIEQLAKGEAVFGEVPFPDGSKWNYQIQAKDQQDLFQVHRSSNGISISIKKKSAIALQETDLVGQEELLTTPNSTLKILVEKDFKCLTPREEDESNLFKNPNEVC